MQNILEKMKLIFNKVLSFFPLIAIAVSIITLVNATYDFAYAKAGSFHRMSYDFEVDNLITAGVSFNPSPCEGTYYGFYWFGDGPIPYAFADIPISDIGKDFVRNWMPTIPYIELAGVIVSDKPFGMTELESDSQDQFGVAWPPGVHICAPDDNPLVNSSENPDERFHIN